MKQEPFTPEQVKFIKENYLTMGAKTMANKLGIGNTRMNNYMRKNNLIVPEEIKKTFKYINRPVTSSISKHDDFLKENYLIYPIKTMATMLGLDYDITVRTRLRQLGLVIPKEIIEQRKKDSRFDKGHVPANKGLTIDQYMSPETAAKVRQTSFKKGHLPHNTINEPGAITIRTYGVGKKDKKRNYKIKYIQISLGEWKPLHIHNWESVNGKVPDGFILWFKDQNSLNPEVENLELITRAESMKRTSFHNYPEDLKEIINLKTQITKHINKHVKSQKNER